MNLKTFLSIAALLVLASCNTTPNQQLIIFHAGSLSVPFREVADSFERANPGVNVLLEAAGSTTCARKITDLNRPCDILASADYKVIDNLLIPAYADNNYHFATNEMVLVYRPDAMFANEIDSSNWMQLLQNSKVSYGRSDPNSDPCGYRAIMMMKLAESKYNLPGLTANLCSRNTEHIRPKASDLMALLESKIIDYVFEYRSVAMQFGFPYIRLNDSLNLSNPKLEEWYSQVSVLVSGKAPGDSITLHGEPMDYSLALLKDAPNKALANKFLRFFFTDSVGIKAMEKNFQPAFIPADFFPQ